jgi:hypothetical protein
MFPMNWAIRGRPVGGTKEKKDPFRNCSMQKEIQVCVHTLKVGAASPLFSLSLSGGVTEHGLFPFVRTTPPAKWISLVKSGAAHPKP